MDKFKVVLMDNLMPIMNGVDATKALRLKGFPNLIVGVTGNAMEEDVSIFMDAGADFVVAKPLKKHDIENILQRAASCKAKSMSILS